MLVNIKALSRVSNMQSMTLTSVSVEVVWYEAGWATAYELDCPYVMLLLYPSATVALGKQLWQAKAS